MDLKRLVGDVLGDSIVSIKPLTGGASYSSYQVSTGGGVHRHVRTSASDENGDDALLRVGLATEAEMLRRAADRSVPVPKVIAFLDEPELLVTEWLEGETLGGRIVRREKFDNARQLFARQCGEALGRVHSIPTAGLTLEHQTPEQLIRQTHQRYRALGAVRPMLDGVAHHLLSTAPSLSEPCLVHGDFRNGNLMVDSNRGIVGVLDWELARIGDPMQDLGYLLLNSWRFGVPEREVGGCGSVEDLFEAYEAETGVSVDEDRVRWWQAAGSFWWGVTCLVQASRFDANRPETLEFAAIGPRVSEAEVDCANLLVPGVMPVPHPIQETDPYRSRHLLAAVRSTHAASDYRSKVIARMTQTVEREVRLGFGVQNQELSGLIEIVGASGWLDDLRVRLADSLWGGHRLLTDPEIAEHLVRTALNQLQIDQPGYSAPPLTDRSIPQDRRSR